MTVHLIILSSPLSLSAGPQQVLHNQTLNTSACVATTELCKTYYFNNNNRNPSASDTAIATNSFCLAVMKSLKEIKMPKRVSYLKTILEVYNTK